MNLLPSVISIVITMFSAAKVFSGERNHEIPVRWWVAHILLCLLIGFPIPIQNNVLILMFFAIFCIILLDSYSKNDIPVLQILMLIGCGIFLLFYKWQNIISTPNGFLVFVLTYLLSFFPQVYTGIMFFCNLKYQRNFPPLDIALVLTADYLLCLTTGGVISKIF
ncbi:hypothetical protein VF06_28695 [Nostoc linckia z4]|uniref:Uncharacterized protein n=2 Tax=Nostoc linckia TaxID=92942 RepID=A0A9Q5Z779_NOSLI|nr:hypothetical protein [Nostoc linckia]PHK22218.1 hypothetical protein VF12_38365 [Nostoc linckia z15]PHJ67012.1 hypothetical protein VF02_06820 [Nostoc linckia z1]PHJ67742.1 hypothetical protein VF05_17145 [Nostoc linckia z3]PHJ77274.1 hypothetical protein VF03_05380 [Nostoc linckia z2]PHJ78152.1 hypothetical protein VF06_28695 [Nostoc linckia z4]